MAVETLVLIAIVVVGLLWLRHEQRQGRQDLLQLIGERAEADRVRGQGDLEKSQQQVDQAVEGLQKQLERYESLMKTFESDREQKYGKLGAEIQRVVEVTEKLTGAHSELVSVLGNSRVRGQWGEKMAEDVLRACGLQEGIQYVREKEIAAGRPDYTFKLPGDHSLFMDVKFPLDHYLAFTRAEDAIQRDSHREAFVKDVRGHIRDMERRDYTAQEESVDFLVIFIPNEQVYGAVNEWMPGLIDECLQKKIILCGPWTLYAVLRIIMQAWQNYHYSMAIRDIVQVIDGFMRDYGKFRDRFQELGDRIEKVAEKHREIAEISHRRLESKIRKIEEYRKGQQIPHAVQEQELNGIEQIQQEVGG